MKNNNNLLKNIILLLFGTVMGLIIVETGLRVVGYSAPVFREPNAVLGWRGTANLEGSHRIENVTFNRFNSRGYHDREHNKAKKQGTFRIAVVGDSFVQSSEVTLSDHFVPLMGKEINTRLSSAKQTVEVINFGISGYSTSQELILLKTEIREYQPDMVLLMVYPGNDIIDNSYELSTTLREMRPYFIKHADQSLSQKSGFPNPDKTLKDAVIVKVINTSRLLQLSKEALKRLSISELTGSDQTENKKQPEDDVFLEQHSELWKQAWDLTETLIAEFAKETTAFGADFLMAVIAVPIQVHPLESERVQFMTALNLKRLDYPNSRLSKFAQRSGFTHISLVEPFFDLSSTGVYLHGFDRNSFGKGHWNSKGHHLAAKVLAEKIVKDIKLQ